MKKAISFILVILLLFLLIPNGAYLAADDSRFVFKTADAAGNLMLEEYKGDEEIVDIPEEYNGKKITVIGNLSFEYKGVVREIHFPKTITEIRTNAFFGCVKCEKYVVSPENETYSSEDGIIYSKDMKTLCFCPEFYQAETFVVKDGITEIGQYAFRFHKNYGASSSGNYGYSLIKHIEFPNTLTKINSAAFSGTRIEEFIFPDSVSQVASNILSDNSVYKKIHIGAGMKAESCSSWNSSTLKEITVSDGNEELCSEENLLFSKDKKVLYCVPGAMQLNTFRIPDGVETIEKNAFAGNSIKAIDFNEAKIIKNPFEVGKYYITKWVFPKSAEYVEGDIPIKTKSLTFLNRNCQIALTCKYANSYSSNYIFDVNGYYGSTAEEFAKNISSNKITATFVPFHTEDTESDIHSYLHDYKGTVIAPNCTERGYTLFECEICGIQYKDNYVNPLGHDYKPLKITPPSCTESGYTVYQCSRCPAAVRNDYTIPSGHNMVVEEKTDPTCTENGIIKYKCLNCSETNEKSINAIGHSFDVESVVKPTCTTSGHTTYICQNCLLTYDGDYVEPLGHSYSTSIIAATHSEDGVATARCIRCLSVKSKHKIPKIQQVSLNKTAYVYSGKAIKMSAITAKSSDGKTISSENYIVTYISRSDGKQVKSVKDIGQYKANIKFINEYSGENTFYFYVKPKKTAIKKPLTSKNTVTAAWTRDKSVSGYQVYIAANKGFTSGLKKYSVNKNSTVSKKITKLKKGKRYYIKVRSYKNVKVDGKTTKMYSDFSSIKSIVCK